MNRTPLSERLQIVLLGVRNAGKSSLMNNLFKKEVCIVSEAPGTTTDPVTKAMELLPIGPVAITDTAGLDDEGSLGELRIKKTEEKVNNSDLIIFVTPTHLPPTEKERVWLDKVLKLSVPFVFALTFSEKLEDSEKIKWIKPYQHVKINNLTGKGIEELKTLLIERSRKINKEKTPLEGLVSKGELVLLVVPIDLAAPKGRLILPQVETIRDLLDKDCGALIVKENELKNFYWKLNEPPKLVITDSQAFHKVAADLPKFQKLTSFSILFARKKGDLKKFLEGILAINNMPSNSKVIVIEACSHHTQPEDIGTVKIPRLFKQLVKADAQFKFYKSLPSEEELKGVFLAIMCGSCMTTRQETLNRINFLEKNGVKVTNYGIFLAWANGLLPRVLEPFTDEYNFYRNKIV